MANLDEAFNLQYNPRTVNLPQLNKPKYDKYENTDAVYAEYNGNAFQRVKVSDPKYDDMRPRCNKNPTYGYECNSCHGSVGYHMKIQKKYPHDFEKGKFRQLTEEESGTLLSLEK